MSSKKVLVLGVLVVLAVVHRWWPHPPNFTPVMAIALFAGALVRPWQLALFVPILSLFISDMALGFHDQMLGVYLSFALAVLVGREVGARQNSRWGWAMRLSGGVVASSVVFFLVSNFFVWAFSGMYARSLSGLVQSYVMAIPFFHRELAGNFFYSFILFGGYEFVRRFFLRPVSTPQIQKESQSSLGEL